MVPYAVAISFFFFKNQMAEQAKVTVKTLGSLKLSPC